MMKSYDQLNADVYLKQSLKAVFQLRVFYTYVHPHKSLNQIAFEVNKCFDGENSAFSTI